MSGETEMLRPLEEACLDIDPAPLMLEKIEPVKVSFYHCVSTVTRGICTYYYFVKSPGLVMYGGIH